MRAVQFDMVDPAFPASLVDLPEPELPGAAWARVEVTTGGICGSDLHLFRPQHRAVAHLDDDGLLSFFTGP